MNQWIKTYLSYSSDDCIWLELNIINIDWCVCPFFSGKTLSTKIITFACCYEKDWKFFQEIWAAKVHTSGSFCWFLGFKWKILSDGLFTQFHPHSMHLCSNPSLLSVYLSRKNIFTWFFKMPVNFAGADALKTTLILQRILNGFTWSEIYQYPSPW